MKELTKEDLMKALRESQEQYQRVVRMLEDAIRNPENYEIIDEEINCSEIVKRYEDEK